MGRLALIVDDEADARGVLRELIDLFCPKITEAHEAANSREAIKLAQRHNYDIVFIDIEMGEENGLDLSEHLFHYCANLIFVTAHDSYAIEAFKTPAMHYLLKPVNPSYLCKAVEKALSFRGKKAESKPIMLHLREGIFILNPKDIMHVSGEGNYSTFHLSNSRSLVASKHLSFYEELLDSSLFFRIHQSHLVRLDQVKQIDTQNGTFVVMSNDERLPLARRRKEDFLKALSS